MQIFSIATLLACTALLALYRRRVARRGRAIHARLGDSPGSACFPGWVVEAGYWALQVPGRALIRLGVSPDVITYASLVVSLGSLPAAAAGHLGWAALAVLAGGGLDALDGMVARASGCDGSAGSMLDAVVDRVADAAPFVGLAIFYRDCTATLVVPLSALVASSLISYARAKAETLGLDLPSGPMRRHERIAYLSLGLLLGPIAPSFRGVAFPITLLVVAIVGLLSLASSLLLMARARTALLVIDRARPRPPPT